MSQDRAPHVCAMPEQLGEKWLSIGLFRSLGLVCKERKRLSTLTESSIQFTAKILEKGRICLLEEAPLSV